MSLVSPHFQMEWNIDVVSNVLIQQIQSKFCMSTYLDNAVHVGDETVNADLQQHN